MPNAEEALTISVSGTPTQVMANLHEELTAIVERALHQTNHFGQPPDQWDLKDQAGTVLDQHQKVQDLHLAAGATLFLSPKAGIGG